jgi:cell division protein FtsW (lipid II flippase)
VKSLKDSFLAEVLQQIKSREARDLVHKELNDHLGKSKAGFIAKGMNEEEAEEKAVLQMGSPIELGEQFNKLHRPKIDWLLLGLFMVALLMSFLPLLNIQEMYHENLMVKQGIYIGIGILLAFSMMFVDYRRMARWGATRGKGKIKICFFVSLCYNHRRKVSSFFGFCLVWRLNNTIRKDTFLFLCIFILLG